MRAFVWASLAPHIYKVLVIAVALIATVEMLALPGWSQHFDRLDRERTQVMLQNVASDVRKNYYDPKLHGVDWDAKVEEAKKKIAKAASWDDAILQIAALLETLNDSHTFFFPTQYLIREDYGWQFQTVGKHCYVTQVRPKSDAESKGLKPGDEVLTVDGFAMTRESAKKIDYVVNTLLPQPSLRVQVRDSFGKVRQFDVMARVRQHRQIMDASEMTGRDAQEVRLEREDERKLMRPRSTFEGDLMIVKLPVFLDTEVMIADLIGKARKHGNLILDLRGNPGGSESTLQDLVNSVFDKDVKIGDRVTREAPKPVMASGSHRGAYAGKLIVLVDSGSASASELFARVVQIEKRGVVLGDRTSGSVMEARQYGHRTGINPSYYYGTSVAVADLVMTDGKSLENTGVMPDETIIPSAEDLANGRDPVMVRAAELAGVTLTPDEAGKLFPYEWPKN
jgi:carboxyl-terminal processing protease